MGRSGLGGEEATLDTTQAGVSEYLDNSVSMWTKWRDVAEQPRQNGAFVAVVKTIGQCTLCAELSTLFSF